MNPESPVQRQLAAYNDRDLDRFVAEYSDDVRVYRAPTGTPILDGKAAFSAHYAAHRFNLTSLHADVLARLVVGNKVIDHERVIGVRDQPFDAVVVYEVVDDLIRAVWFFDPS